MRTTSTNTRADYIHNIGSALQALGYSLRGLDLTALATDLHDFATDPAKEGPAGAIRQLGILNSVLPQYKVEQRHRVRIPRRGNFDPHIPDVIGGEDLADRSKFSFAEWLDATTAFAATAGRIGVDLDVANLPQDLADLLNGAMQPLRVNDRVVSRLAGHYGLNGLHDALTGQNNVAEDTQDYATDSYLAGVTFPSC